MIVKFYAVLSDPPFAKNPRLIHKRNKVTYKIYLFNEFKFKLVVKNHGCLLLMRCSRGISYSSLLHLLKELLYHQL